MWKYRASWAMGPNLSVRTCTDFHINNKVKVLWIQQAVTSNIPVMVSEVEKCCVDVTLRCQDVFHAEHLKFCTGK